MNYLDAEQLIKQYQHLIGKSIAPQVKGWSLPIRFMIIAPRD